MDATTQPTEGPQLFRIPEENLEALRERIQKVSKKAMKLVGQPVTLMVHSHEDVKLKNDTYRRYYLVSVQGPQPKLNGWVFAAALDVVDVEGSREVMVRTAPGESIPTSLRTRTEGCDHCHTSRYRKTLYVLRKA